MNQTTEESVLEYHIEHFEAFSVGLFERQPLTYNPRSLALKLEANGDKICYAKAASGMRSRGYQIVMQATYGPLTKKKYDVIADAVLTNEPKSAVIFRNGDCPIVTIHELTKRRTVILHCGRPALTPRRDKHGRLQNIVSLACAELLRGIQKPQVHAHIAGSICPEHFVHDSPEGQELVKPFDCFGQLAFSDRQAGKLDLVSIIAHQIKCEVFQPKITHDNLCTFETPWAASHRRHPTEPWRSPVVVVLH